MASAVALHPAAGTGCAAGASSAPGSNGNNAASTAAATGLVEANTELRKAAAVLTSNRHSNESGTSISTSYI